MEKFMKCRGILKLEKSTNPAITKKRLSGITPLNRSALNLFSIMMGYKQYMTCLPFPRLQVISCIVCLSTVYRLIKVTVC